MTLAEEAQRYLAVVEFFRSQGCEPRWRPESGVERAGLSASSQRHEELERRNKCTH